RSRFDLTCSIFVVVPWKKGDDISQWRFLFQQPSTQNHRCRTKIYGTLHLPLRGYTVLRFLRGLRGFTVEDRDGDRLGREDDYDVVTSSYKFAESGYKCGERIFGSFAGREEDLRENCQRCANSERIRGVSPIMRGFMGASAEMGLSVARDAPERCWRCVGAFPERCIGGYGFNGVCGGYDGGRAMDVVMKELMMTTKEVMIATEEEVVVEEPVEEHVAVVVTAVTVTSVTGVATVFTKQAVVVFQEETVIVDIEKFFVG
ncbi:hypothetical protein IGI04_025719, partial [Brassica rapa subsp. trilocularis]